MVDFLGLVLGEIGEFDSRTFHKWDVGAGLLLAAKAGSIPVQSTKFMKFLCKYKGGSHAYGLSTPTSDVDWRGVFVNTELSDLVGLSKHEHQESNVDGTDEVFKELRAFLGLLRQSNSQAIEALYENNFELLTSDFELIRQYRNRLVDSHKLFSMLRGYSFGELKLANGERTGKLGGKRKETIDKYGFSPKNFVQLFRLNWAGTIFFSKGYFPVNVQDEDPKFAEKLLSIKTEPEKYTKEQLNLAASNWDAWLKKAYENRASTRLFDEPLANELCYLVYYPYIRDAQSQMTHLKLLPPKVKL